MVKIRYLNESILQMKLLVVKILFLLSLFLYPLEIFSQVTQPSEIENDASGNLYNEEVENQEFIQKVNNFEFLKNFKDWSEKYGVANHLSAGVSLGSMGIGLELETPASKWANIRAGVDWIPKFNKNLLFNIETYASGLPTGNFHNVAELVYNMTGIEMDEKVNMKGTGSMINFKFMVDVYPIPSNRHWHITAGFYAGTSMFAKAVNAYEEKPTLVGLNIYNRAYEYFIGLGDDIFNVPLGNNTYMDPDLVEKIQQRFERYGRMGIHIGDFKDGTPYIMEPAPDGTVSAYAYVNHFKPYLGAGYSTALDKSGKWNLAIDLGVIFWGGVPDLLNHDYTTGKDINFTKDLIKLRRNVDRYIKVFKAFPVYPGLAIRISYNIL